MIKQQENNDCLQKPFLLEHSDYSKVDNVCGLIFDEKILITMSSNNIKFWDMESYECVKSIKIEEGTISSTIITPDKNTIITGGTQNLQFWDITSGECYKTVEAHKKDITALAITSDGKRLISKSTDKTVKIWDIDDKIQCLTTLKGYDSYLPNLIALSPDDTMLVLIKNNDTIVIVDTLSGKVLKRFQKQEHSITALAITPDGKTIITASANSFTNGKLHFWDIKSGKCIKTIKNKTKYTIKLAITPDGKKLITRNDNGAFHLWDIQNYKYLGLLDIAWGSSCMLLSLDGTHLISGGVYGIKVFDIDSKKLLHNFGKPLAAINTITISPNSELLAFCTYGNGYAVKLYLFDIKSKKSLISFQSIDLVVDSLAFTPDSNRLIIYSSFITSYWDIRSGELLQVVKKNPNDTNPKRILYIESNSVVATVTNDTRIEFYDKAHTETLYTYDYLSDITIDNNGYFQGSDDNIEKYIRVSDKPFHHRKLNANELKHYRKSFCIEA